METPLTDQKKKFHQGKKGTCLKVIHATYYLIFALCRKANLKYTKLRA